MKTKGSSEISAAARTPPAPLRPSGYAGGVLAWGPCRRAAVPPCAGVPAPVRSSPREYAGGCAVAGPRRPLDTCALIGQLARLSRSFEDQNLYSDLYPSHWKKWPNRSKWACAVRCRSARICREIRCFRSGRASGFQPLITRRSWVQIPPPPFCMRSHDLAPSRAILFFGPVFPAFRSNRVRGAMRCGRLLHRKLHRRASDSASRFHSPDSVGLPERKAPRGLSWRSGDLTQQDGVQSHG